MGLEGSASDKEVFLTWFYQKPFDFDWSQTVSCLFLVIHPGVLASASCAAWHSVTCPCDGRP